jgi:hypothetical protein
VFQFVCEGSRGNVHVHTADCSVHSMLMSNVVVHWWEELGGRCVWCVCCPDKLECVSLEAVCM